MSEDEKETKACPFCAELILAAAIKCKHCGERLDEPRTVERESEPEPEFVPVRAATSRRRSIGDRAKLWLTGLAIFAAIMWFALGFKNSPATGPQRPTVAEARAKLEAKPPKTLGDVIEIIDDDEFMGCEKDEYFEHANCSWAFSGGRVVAECEHNRNFARVLRIRYVEY